MIRIEIIKNDKIYYSLELSNEYMAENAPNWTLLEVLQSDVVSSFIYRLMDMDVMIKRRSCLYQGTDPKGKFLKNHDRVIIYSIS